MFIKFEKFYIESSLIGISILIMRIIYYFGVGDFIKVIWHSLEQPLIGIETFTFILISYIIIGMMFRTIFGIVFEKYVEKSTIQIEKEWKIAA